MKIGVKFCGGCNPSYDRGEAYNNYRKLFPEHTYETVSLQSSYDRILVICGCDKACLREYREAEAKEYLIFTKKNDFDQEYPFL
ncbi:MAG: hypothetical protein Q4B85_06890 [Lachnospiraceae bacterium]|nr:hypothetical protein [Lachnospiraceae bacterium]